MSVKVKIIKQLTDNYSYIIYSNETKEALILDPAEPKPILDFLNSENLLLQGILVTHHHSDHTSGILAATLSVMLGASLIEKHFMLDKKDGGVDSAFSIEPNVYAINLRGIFFVSRESFCLNEPDAAFLGFANFSFKFSKSFFVI